MVWDADTRLGTNLRLRPSSEQHQQRFDKTTTVATIARTRKKRRAKKTKRTRTTISRTKKTISNTDHATTKTTGIATIYNYTTHYHCHHSYNYHFFECYYNDYEHLCHPCLEHVPLCVPDEYVYHCLCLCVCFVFTDSVQVLVVEGDKGESGRGPTRKHPFKLSRR